METLRERIKRQEGRSLHPYRDTMGRLTIGWGRCLDTMGISGLEAEILFENDLSAIYSYFDKLPEAIKNQCNPARKEAILEMFFQLGYVGTMEFKRMFKAIEQGDFEVAADEMLLSKWYQQTPSRCRELSDIMRAG